VYLGIDIGTSGVKAVLVNEAGAVVATAARELALSHPAPLWSEQDPDAWVDATIGAIDDLAARHSREVAQVRGIGLSGQMHGATLLGEDGQPLRPAILWNDGRSQAECAALERRCPSLHAIAGNLAMPGFTAPKLLWVARHEPEIFDRVAKVLLPKAYVRYRLTGEMVEDMSDAAGTLWLDVGLRRWFAPLLHATGLDLHHMPRLVEGSAVSALLAPDYARRWGMTGNVVVAGGAGDNAASAIGLGAIAPGDAFLSLGTSGVLFRVTDRFAPAPASAVHAFCHALPGLWHQMGVMLSAAASLAWLAGVMETPAAALLAPLGERVDTPGTVQFLPYLDGAHAAQRCRRQRRLHRLARRDRPEPDRAGRAGRRRLCRARQAGGAERSERADCRGRSRRRRLALAAVGADLRRRARHSRPPGRGRRGRRRARRRAARTARRNRRRSRGRLHPSAAACELHAPCLCSCGL